MRKNAVGILRGFGNEMRHVWLGIFLNCILKIFTELWLYKGDFSGKFPSILIFIKATSKFQKNLENFHTKIRPKKSQRRKKQIK
jgi:hypothetical protein